MSRQIECPICMDAIEVNKNYITTECGHCFHANCLMKSVAHNGFGCPYCRTTMAEVPDDDDASSNEDNEDIYNNDILRGLRFFNNNLEGIVHDEDDEDAEDDYQTELLDAIQPDEPDVTIPTTQFVANKLREQGINYDQVVSLILFNNHEEYDIDALERLDSEVFGKIRRIVSNYTPEQAVNEPLPQLIRIVGRTTTPVPQVGLIFIEDDEYEYEDEDEINMINVKEFIYHYKKTKPQQLIKNINLNLSLRLQELLLGKILFVFILYAFSIVIVN